VCLTVCVLLCACTRGFKPQTQSVIRGDAVFSILADPVEPRRRAVVAYGDNYRHYFDALRTQAGQGTIEQLGG
jgi:hypothetical protein